MRRSTSLGLGLLGLALLALGTLTLNACRKTGSELSGSTYCDPSSGSSQIDPSKLPSGSCKGSSTCIAFTAGDPCASNASIAAPDCQWTCSCVDDTWSCSQSCERTACPEDGGELVDASSTD